MILRLIQIVLGILLVYVAIIFGRDLIKHKHQSDGSIPVATGIGFVTNFLDALGIGSYAPTTLLLKATKYLKSDKLIPGTLTVACSIPVIVEAFLFTNTIKVEGPTLISMVVAAGVGSAIGSKVMTKFNEKIVRIVMGIALVATAVLMLLSQLGVLSALGAGNTAIGLHGINLVIAVVGNFILGALMTAGVGLYAPCMALVYMLGMSPAVAFPIMMTSAAVLMPIASYEFIKSGNYNRNASLGITIGGVIGVAIAVLFVKSLDLNVLTWLIIVVVTYTGLSMLYQGIKQRSESVQQANADESTESDPK
ncbi:sulfite exporter TauE/SafE family protein [Companilactobacillus mishanensis]|uniref:Probable membrane transporter protein n=1 Tax=Companilactobacillus mishanensis TaxID=2486008 RepID=A0A5P0ZHB1_9LACO|nr:sulfite exporter TauE/SafE family protein [Companilactobacillus mishanensis]MQS44946.1 sulfite exporter TauE/SafE family protein [Companilactobacillus mishanensis]MQS52375.1 sulfite exporter TauE/SafE family protein [Companilactobacillus mishanensis]MQS89461.1 sulfite exporter TauE/SafE family protein [Companilactobacillus mishanensis]